MSTRNIKIDGKEVALTATGATPIFYEDFFKEDLLRILAGSGDLANQASMVTKLAFIMNKQAEGASYDEFKTMTEKDFVRWADKYSFAGINEAAGDIAAVLSNASEPAADLKKTETKTE